MRLARVSMIGYRGGKIEEARQWILDYLSKAPKTGSVPEHAEIASFILRKGQETGFSPQLLARARRELLGLTVKVEHVPGSRQWMWRLVAEKKKPTDVEWLQEWVQEGHLNSFEGIPEAGAKVGITVNTDLIRRAGLEKYQHKYEGGVVTCLRRRKK
jgi:hypothetical protein